VYAAIDSLDAFKRLAVDFPAPGEINATPEEIEAAARRFQRSLDQAVAAARRPNVAVPAFLSKESEL